MRPECWRPGLHFELDERRAHRKPPHSMTRQPAIGKELFQGLFEPRSIPLVGASGDPKKNTSRPQRYLRKHGYKGRIIPVNPGRDEIAGDKAYPDVASIPEAVDHAFIMVPAKAVKSAIE